MTDEMKEKMDVDLFRRAGVTGFMTDRMNRMIKQNQSKKSNFQLNSLNLTSYRINHYYQSISQYLHSVW